MNKIYAIICLTFSLWLLTSCATIFNSKKAKIQVATTELSKLIVNGDTLPHSSRRQYVTLERSKKPITLTIFNDSCSKTLLVKSKNSLLYWLNFYPSFGIGFIVDTRTKKRYTYPSTIYVDMKTPGDKYLRYIPLDPNPNPYNNIIKFTPQKTVAQINPGLEIAYERKTGNRFSTQLMGSYLFPLSILQIPFDIRPNTRGYRVAVEEKFYLKKSAPLGHYVSIEANHLRSSYDHLDWFVDKKNPNDTSEFRRDYMDSIKIKRRNFSFNLKYGYQHVKKRFSIDVYFGIGIRYTEVKHLNRINPQSQMLLSRRFYTANPQREGSDWSLCIPVNIRIGRTF